jgi:hypothetical protein
MRLARHRRSQRRDSVEWRCRGTIARSSEHPAQVPWARGGRVALDDPGTGEDEGFEGPGAQPGRVDRLIQGPWLLVRASARGLRARGRGRRGV